MTPQCYLVYQRGQLLPMLGDFASSIGISMDYAQEEFEQSILDTILNPMGSPV